MPYFLIFEYYYSHLFCLPLHDEDKVSFFLARYEKSFFLNFVNRLYYFVQITGRVDFS